MRGKGGVCVSDKVASSALWQEPILPNQNKHVRMVWIKRGGPTKIGSGPSGYKLTPARVLARSLAERPNVAQAVKARQQAKEKARATVSE